jgi:hypothetical protein
VGDVTEALYLRRKILTDNSTIGELYLQDGTFQCFTLEDKVRNFKIAKETAIPAGTYEIAVTFSARFNRPMPQLLNVEFFDGIRIHNGNTKEHTEGCILTGKKHGDDCLHESMPAFDDLFSKIKKWVEKDKLFIKIEGGYPADAWLKEKTETA